MKIIKIKEYDFWNIAKNMFGVFSKEENIHVKCVDYGVVHTASSTTGQTIKIMIITLISSERIFSSWKAYFPVCVNDWQVDSANISF